MESSIRSIGAVEIPCNWLQCMENSADPVHTEYLHGHLMRYVTERMGADENTRARAGANFLRHHLKIGFERHEYGMIKRRFQVGDPDDDPDWVWGHLLVFPDMVRLGGGSSPSSSFQIRVPIDDYRTWHLVYSVVAPPGMKLPKQEVIPMYVSPIVDKEGNAILDYVLGQDMVAWWSQDDITHRYEEKLGDSDKGVILFRRMLKEQLNIVEDGGDPMNTFRDPAENQYLDLDLYHGMNPRIANERMGIQQTNEFNPRFNPHFAELQALLAQATPIQQ
jgi:5,5'-dehydrodivanillate O-demethylase